jgi:hypothetical protein
MHRIAGIAAVLVLLTGCYTLAPVSGTPQPGTRLAFDVNDAGRVALGGSMGPEIGQIEGTLIQRDNGEYLLGVTSVSLLRGGVQTWKGEQVRIKPEFVGNMYTRKLDKTRTVLLSAVLVGGGALAIASATNLLGSADPNDPTIPKDTGATNRLPGRFRIPIWSLRLPYLGRP